MAMQLRCPCGEHIAARDDQFLAAVRGHLRAAHPERDYSDNEISLLATSFSDNLLPEHESKS
jgi:hypothetical protein